MKNAAAVKVERQSLLRLASNGMPGLFNFDADPIEVRIVGDLKRLRISSPGWGRISLELIRTIGRFVPDPRKYRILSSSPPVVGTGPDPFQGVPFMTKWEHRPWSNSSSTPRFGSRASSCSTDQARCIKNFRDRDRKQRGTSHRYRHPSPDRYRAKCAAFSRRAATLADSAATCLKTNDVAEAFRRAAFDLVESIIAALDGRDISSATLQDLRTDAAATCLRMADAMGGAEIAKVIADIGWCLDQVFARGVAEDDDPSDLRVPSAAYILLAEVLKSSPLTPTVDIPVRNATGVHSRSPWTPKFLKPCLANATTPFSEIMFTSR